MSAEDRYEYKTGKKATWDHIDGPRYTAEFIEWLKEELKLAETFAREVAELYAPK
jgi:hypothetical protein